jgi:hypothetical protein
MAEEYADEGGALPTGKPGVIMADPTGAIKIKPFTKARRL